MTHSFKRMPDQVCGSLAGAAASPTTCVDGAGTVDVVRSCADGTAALDPLFRRPTDPTTGLFTGPWEQVDDGGCPEDPAVTVAMTAEDFRRLPLVPSTPSYQPVDGRGLVNKPLIVYTDPAPQTLATTVLGVPVTVRATPVQYAWDFGDGASPLVTTDPGAPYPDDTVSRPYAVPGEYAVRLTTTWRGEFRVSGTGPWTPVDGTATTTSAPFTATVEEAIPRLVAGP
ncbi:PKD domain-containing protein [Actinotalea sp. Marseille-Q4924]|uniref:PKD domain-containing protein n=1 Tax=Actinotalea sp. Marseille-Q4924 TaxID=2866571 RepID=UPI001CE4AC94|nr:PKD domain-containing protein [Actinotalea sp. Marseille-Q4924]